MMRPLSIIVVLLLWPASLVAQTGRVNVEEENFRAGPGAQVIATVRQGTTLQLGDRNGRWRAATLEAWIWSASVKRERRDGHDLVVSAADGENLRDGPNGAIVARAKDGMLLTEVERQGRWIRVRRNGWIWEPSLAVADVAPSTKRSTATTQATSGAATRPTARTESLAAPTSTPPSATASAQPRAPRDQPDARREWARAGAAGAELLAAPDGEALASVRAGTTVETLAREGNWTRVRVEGWVWQPSLDEPAGTAEAAVLRDVSVEELAARPDAFRARILEWPLQFIALEHADRIRTDFYEGEPYILTRGPADEAGFVYVAVPPEWIERVERLSPLQRIIVTARVRNPNSSLMNAPVLDLLDLTVSRE